MFTRISIAADDSERPIITHGPIYGSVELSAEHRTDTQTGGASNRTNKTAIFREKVTAGTEGSVYHPNLLFYNVALGVGLTQQNVKSDENSGWNNGTLDEYNVMMQFLREKNYPLTVSMSRYDDFIARSFLGPMETTQENASIVQSIRSKDWPMTFQYTTHKTTQRDVVSDSNDFFNLDSKEFSYFLDHNFSRLSHMRIEYEKSDVTQSSPGSTTTVKQDEFTFLHDLIFGKQERHRLDTYFSYLNETGTSDYKYMQWSERLLLQHTENFRTIHELQVTNLSQQTDKTEEIRLTNGFEHQLYESLITTGQAYISQSKLENNTDIKQTGESLAFAYQKENPLGKLFSVYSISMNQFDQTGGGGTGVVLNESHIANDVFPVQLNQTNIDISTIEVKNSIGLLFQEGEDYTISVIGNRTFLNIITVGGVTPPNFTNGEQFFVDYNYTLSGDQSQDTVNQRFTIRQRFENGISVYYMHDRQDQTVSPSDANDEPDSFRTNTFGIDYTKKGLFLLAEYAKHDSATLPWDSKRVEGRYGWSISPQTTASVFASDQWLSFGGVDPYDTTLFLSGAEVFSRLMEKYSLSTRLNYRDETNSKSGPTTGWQLRSELQYNYRRLIVTTGVEYSLLSRSDDETTTTFVYLRVKRLF